MAYKLMIQGTMSSAGKSFIVTALCKVFADMGYKVCPFKSQNMALNSGVTMDGLEMGRAQIVQAEAAGIMPDVRMNPILLKPNSDIGSQVIVMGRSIGNMTAKEYYQYKTTLIPVIKSAFKSLEEDYDVIIVEGAGSPAEINLKDNDIVNMGLATMLNIPVLLVGDIDLGGVFAQLLGTVEWLTQNERNMIKGILINKFRGDVSLLTPGIKMLEDRIDKKVLGVIPMCSVSIDEEDSVTKTLNKESAVADEHCLRIKVVRLPHMSNFTDFDPLERLSFVKLSYVNLPDDICENDDLIIIPGTKSTINDMKWLISNGLAEKVVELSKSIPVIGICGGFQMLGKSIYDEAMTEGYSYIEGMNILDVDTRFQKDKKLEKTTGCIEQIEGFFSCINGAGYCGYEIHQGESFNASKKVIFAGKGNVLGTYIHGLFDKADVVKALIKGLYARKNMSFLGDKDISDYENVKEAEYEKLADVFKKAVDVEEIIKIMLDNENGD